MVRQEQRLPIEPPRRSLRGVKTKVLAGAAVIALCLAPVASAKFKLWLTLGDSTPRIGQPVRVVLHAEQDLDYDLKLIAVAPDKSLRDVVGRVTGDSSRGRASIPRDGFAVPVTRIAPNRWRAFVKFPRAGRWRLLIPNGAAVGFTIPPPALETVVVSR
jgi:hypothetical protein